MKLFLSGGAKNGKSSLAQELAVRLAQGGDRYYVATMIPVDGEDRERIRRHVADRAGMGFQTVECGRHILKALEGTNPKGTFLLDSVTALLMNELFPAENGYALDETAPKRCLDELAAFAQQVENAVFVSDYIYSDAQKYDPTTERYRAALAALDRMLAEMCDTVVELSVGQRIVHKGRMPE